MKVISQILPKIGCHGNVRLDIKKEVQIDHLQTLSFDVKIAKIGPADPECQYAK